MEVVTFNEFVSGWRILYLLVVVLTIVAIGRWFYNNVATGKCYYKRYPIAKAIDDLAKSGELKGKNIDSALSTINRNASREFQSGQFTQNIRKQ